MLVARSLFFCGSCNVVADASVTAQHRKAVLSEDASGSLLLAAQKLLAALPVNCQVLGPSEKVCDNGCRPL